jgi:hypothetical protein
MELELEYVLWNVIIWWPPLFMCPEHILSSWPAIKLYLIYQDNDNTAKIIWRFVKYQKDELQGNTKIQLSS